MVGAIGRDGAQTREKRGREPDRNGEEVHMYVPGGEEVHMYVAAA